MNLTKPIQLTLAVKLRDDATFANFVPGQNVRVVQYLQRMIAGHDEGYAYLWGITGAGRSHLLQACCNHMNQHGEKTTYFSLSAHQNLHPEIFENLERLSFICIDDVDEVIGRPEWEEPLFHLYNRVRELNTRLLITASNIPQRLNFHLPDLQSRLASGLLFQIMHLNDEEILMALQLRALNRGLQLSAEVGQYLMHRYPRNMSVLFDVLQTLDHASLVQKRRLTIPFIKNVLEKK